MLDPIRAIFATQELYTHAAPRQLNLVIDPVTIDRIDHRILSCDGNIYEFSVTMIELSQISIEFELLLNVGNIDAFNSVCRFCKEPLEKSATNTRRSD